MSITKCLLLLFLLFGLSVNLETAAASSLIVNGSFETGDFTGWTIGANPSFTPAVGAIQVEDGTYSAEIAGYSSNPDTLSQTVADTSGQSYELSFWRYVTIGTPTNSFVVTWNGIQVYSELNVGASSAFQQIVRSVVGTGSDALVFTVANDPGLTYLDNVSLTSTAVTPLPSALPLFASGVGILGLLGWRRKRKKVAAMAAA
jgi:hypothetical protein